MSLSKVSPIVKCKRPECGRYVVIQAQTFRDDPTGELLQLTLRAAMENAYCEFHRNQRAWYAQQGRLADWEAGRA